ncbi:uncharacterized protein PG986_006197 [Apiospora aurea]|uniref:Uncharacterized protein n=1 Tax=Apiospora aurea TaxID=335848 RepID=A0ABR1QJQ1_9PEZI
MLLRRGCFDFHGALPAAQGIGAERDNAIIAEQPLGEAVVVGRGLSHFDAPEPIDARMISVAVAIIAASLCLSFFMVLAIDGDSFIFVLGSTMLQFSIPLGTYITACRVATVICICFYVSTKLIYLFLVDRSHIVRGTVKGRFRSRLYIFSTFFLIVLPDKHIPRPNNKLSQPTLFPIKTALSRHGRAKAHDVSPGSCSFKLKWADGMIGLESTSLGGWEINTRLERLAVRAFFGSVFTLFSTSTNLITLMVLEGEPAWLCLLTCKADGKLVSLHHWHLASGSTDRSAFASLVLVCSVVLYWITTIDDDWPRDMAASRGDYAPTTAMVRMVSSIGGGGGGGRGGREFSRRASMPPSMAIVPPTPQYPNDAGFGRGSLDITPTPLPTAYHGVFPRDPPNIDKGKGPAVEK